VHRESGALSAAGASSVGDRNPRRMAGRAASMSRVTSPAISLLSFARDSLVLTKRIKIHAGFGWAPPMHTHHFDPFESGERWAIALASAWEEDGCPDLPRNRVDRLGQTIRSRHADSKNRVDFLAFDRPREFRDLTRPFH